MKKIFFLMILICSSTYSQVGIGTETPNASSLLDLSSTSKGLLVPRMTQAQRNAISNPPVGLLVYQTNGQAFYYKDHFWWKILASNDNKSFMVGSIKGGIPNYGSQNLSFGFGNFAYATSGDNNTAIGFMAISGSDGSGNTAVGSNAMRQGKTITDGSYNTAVGDRALSNGDDGDYNTAIGASSIEKVEGDNNSGLGNRTLFNTTTGDANTAVGSNAGDTNTTGSNNTLIGSNSDVGSNNLTNATAIGYNAIVDASNKIRLGDSNITNIETSGTITAGAVTYPNTDGTANQVLKTNGSGTLAWTTPPSPSILYQKTHSDVILTDTVAEIITLSLPAGSYIVTYTGMAYKSSGGAEYVASRIATTIPGSNLGGGDAIMIDPGYNAGRAYVVHQLGITLASAGSVSIYANTLNGSSGTKLIGARLTALTVGAVINQ
jgi:hypothetical protein